MKTDTIIWIIIFLAVGILIGYFVLPTLFQTTGGLGESVFGTSPGVEPPTMPS